MLWQYFMPITSNDTQYTQYWSNIILSIVMEKKVLKFMHIPKDIYLYDMMLILVKVHHDMILMQSHNRGKVHKRHIYLLLFCWPNKSIVTTITCHVL